MNKLLAFVAVVLLSASASAADVPARRIAGSVADKYGSTEAEQVHAWCTYVNKAVKSLHWTTLDACADLDWKVGGTSLQGRPLVYAEFGDIHATNSTLILTMVHGDEITPLYLGLQLAHWVHENQKVLAGTRVVIAPLVNPDGFFHTPRTRMNARGVDVNRNFLTQDWDSEALRAWKTRYRSDPRRYPGPKSNSEPETVFQLDLLKRLRPQKIMSVHSPLNFLDYDGPNPLTLEKFSKEYVAECARLRQQMNAISGTFFPGSLGNFAGQELGIPTLTLELPTANPAKADAYWKQYQKGIRTMIEFKVPPLEANLGVAGHG